MENKHLKKTILDIADDQLKANDPIWTGSGEWIVPEWEEIALLIQNGYDALEHKPIQYPVMTKNWMEAWEILKKLVSGAELQPGISDLDEATDYEYGLEGWLQDMEMELHNAGEHEKRLQFCREALELFSWQHEDSGGYKMAFVESLYALDRKEEGEAYLNDWLEQEPHNAAAINTKSVCLAAEGQEEAAYDCLEQEIGDQSCTLDNEILFARICWLAEKLGKTDKLDFYKEKYKEFRRSLEEMEINPYWGGLPYMPSQPLVKPDKVYPNDPCPCGSGKKYKKCCGKNR